MVSNEVHAGIEFGSLNDLLGGGCRRDREGRNLCASVPRESDRLQAGQYRLPSARHGLIEVVVLAKLAWNNLRGQIGGGHFGPPVILGLCCTNIWNPGLGPSVVEPLRWSDSGI